MDDSQENSFSDLCVTLMTGNANRRKSWDKYESKRHFEAVTDNIFNRHPSNYSDFSQERTVPEFWEILKWDFDLWRFSYTNLTQVLWIKTSHKCQFHPASVSCSCMIKPSVYNQFKVAVHQNLPTNPEYKWRAILALNCVSRLESFRNVLFLCRGVTLSITSSLRSRRAQPITDTGTGRSWIYQWFLKISKVCL